MCAGKLEYGNAQHVDQNVQNPPSQSYGHAVCKSIKLIPIGNVFGKPFFWLEFEAEVLIVNIFGLPHHGEEVFGVMWAVGIQWGIGIGVVHPM